MEFVVHINPEPTPYPPRFRAGVRRISLDAKPADTLRSLINRAVEEVGRDPSQSYFFPLFLLDARESGSSFVPGPRAVIAEDGEFLWSEGAFDRITVADLERAQQRGFFGGDPHGLFLELPAYGDGIPSGWEELFAWLNAIGGVASIATAVVMFTSVLRARYRQWQKRGARTPYAFLDIVLARREWRPDELRQPLGLSEAEATDLLESLGYTDQKEARTAMRGRVRVELSGG